MDVVTGVVIDEVENVGRKMILTGEDTNPSPAVFSIAVCDEIYISWSTW